MTQQEITDKVIRYFSNQAHHIDSNSEVQRIQISGMEGFFEELSWIKSFVDFEPKYFTVKEFSKPGVSGKLCMVSVNRSTAILAFYGDDILWLDQPFRNTDYSVFVDRENLLTWISSRFMELSCLIVETKFAFLFHPILIEKTSDIPRFPIEKQLRSKLELTEDEMSMFESLRESEAKLMSVAHRITPPTLETTPAGHRILTLSAWTRKMGMLFNLECRFEEDNSFDYSGSRIAEFVGRYTR